jgi:hypothetical protein
VLSNKHVNLGPNAEVGQVHSRLDRKASLWNDPPIIMRFEVIHIGACAVHVFAD